MCAPTQNVDLRSANDPKETWPNSYPGTLQPDFQYIFQPGGNLPGVDDAAVWGVRTTLNF